LAAEEGAPEVRAIRAARWLVEAAGDAVGDASCFDFRVSGGEARIWWALLGGVLAAVDSLEAPMDAVGKLRRV